MASALAGTSVTLADIATAQSLIARRSKQKFLLADEESAFRRATNALSEVLGFTNNTRGKSFDAVKVSSILRAATTVLAAK